MSAPTEVSQPSVTAGIIMHSKLPLNRLVLGCLSDGHQSNDISALQLRVADPKRSGWLAAGLEERSDVVSMVFDGQLVAPMQPRLKEPLISLGPVSRLTGGSCGIVNPTPLTDSPRSPTTAGRPPPGRATVPLVNRRGGT
jgi:hypothetical protein